MSNLIFRSSRSFWCIISFCISSGSAWRYGKYLNLSFICICHFQPEFLFLSFFAKTQCILFFLTDAKKWQDLRETPKNCSRCPRTSLTWEWPVLEHMWLRRWVFQDFSYVELHLHFEFSVGHCGRTRAPTENYDIPKWPAWHEDYNGVKQSGLPDPVWPEILKNRFTVSPALWPNQGSYRQIIDTHESVLN